MYNRYHGNSGRVERVEEPARQGTGQTRAGAPQTQTREQPPVQTPRRTGHSGGMGYIPAARLPGALPRLNGTLGKLLRGMPGRGLETEDLLLLLLLFLLYRESGDEEFLFAAAGLLLC